MLGGMDTSREGRRDRLALWATIGFLLLAAQAAPAFDSPWPDGGQRIGLDLFVGAPAVASGGFIGVFPGASLRYLASPRFELSLDYAFIGFEYYYPESGQGPWRGPVPWSAVPGRFSGLRSDWIFYHTKHFVAPQAWVVAPFEALGQSFALRLGAGPALSFVVPSEAAKYYPGLSEAFSEFSTSFEAYLGLSFRVGLEYRPWGFARFGLEYLFIADSLATFGADLSREGIEYVKRSGNLVLFVGGRL
jgi:hypothetical protein